MSRETSQTRTLHHALKNCGGVVELAKALNVSVDSLSPWLTGREAPSVEVYMATLKLLSPTRAKGRR
jgi:transcriptional regulator with XRE-family HTH domain